MKQMNMLLVVGVCLLLSGRVLAMQGGGDKDTVEADALAAIEETDRPAADVQPTDGDKAGTPAEPAVPTVAPAAQVAWYKKLTPSNARAFLAAQWAKVPSKAAFKKWHADLRTKRSFRMMENALGAALTAVLVYQAWIYAHAQCGGETRAAQVACDGAQAVDGFGAHVSATASNIWNGCANWWHCQA